MSTSSSNYSNGIATALLNVSAYGKSGIGADKLINNGSTTLTGIQSTTATTLTVADTTTIVRTTGGSGTALTITNSWHGRVIIIRTASGAATTSTLATAANKFAIWIYITDTWVELTEVVNS